ncbi:type I-D CRISPR-associated protein Cas5/Csc1 [cf. Phormidesmis sp. LEGE 11477]|uniref:type I-D CRISPR-associated protein Cas5/Csc1 n=1 Tax=cf. Phormidesmis sp. LEGE 11477 TaxID=1828680 RepID=UPI001881064A|nr:type I-D CRISPR-associated protein Cas5/Csc1 [cf. Phormidesmis sp. LEGE 11477]MBE9063437.1 type I-D CRISPR-associated protein Cas5/Csc1 [cf. Phormidesmis sp. LEGE 11477]
MTHIYRCTLELHDNLYYATREIGRLYETEPVLHNYALCYALGLVDSDRYATTVANEQAYRYFCKEQVPLYEAHLTPLNQQGIYITPARAVRHASVLSTWKYADNRYHVEMQKTQKNIPSFGRAKEIAPESLFEFFAIARQPLTFPRWIRLGKWMSKAELTVEELLQPQRNSASEFTFPYLLNPLDVMFSNRVLSYDTINMPPVSLIRNVRIEGEYYSFPGLKEPLKLPIQMTYCFSN